MAWFIECRDRARIRTWDRLLRRQMLYPAELRDPLCCCSGCKYNCNLGEHIKRFKKKYHIQDDGKLVQLVFLPQLF